MPTWDRRISPRQRRGFTLIEVMGVVLIMSLLLSVVVSFYLNLTRGATHATQILRDVRRAASVLDRIADDLEHTLLVKKPKDEDPLARPWLFLAQSQFGQCWRFVAEQPFQFFHPVKNFLFAVATEKP